MRLAWIRNSIMRQVLVLIFSVIVITTGFNIAIIILRPPPMDWPVNSMEVARLLKGETIAKKVQGLEVTRQADAPPLPRAEDDVIGRAITRSLGPAYGGVRLKRGPLPAAVKPFEPQMAREFRLYGNESQFSPNLFGSFQAAAQLPDGSWRVVTRQMSQSWQTLTVLRILGSLLIVIPIAWFFSTLFERPIRAVATAIDRLGRREEVKPLPLQGPEEIRLAAAAVNALQIRLKGYIRERTSVVGAVAHDLRTPLSRLNFHLAYAPEDIRVKAEKEIAEMERMISSAIEFVENETRTRTREPVDLALLVEGVIDDMADVGQDVTLVRAAPATVLGDATLLRRMFANLIANAVAYGDRARVAIDVQDGEAVVEVLDAGPGLVSDQLERVFEAFYRAEGSRNRRTGGIGLGLTIVKSVAEAHGGRVMLANHGEGGLSARVAIPLVDR